MPISQNQRLKKAAAKAAKRKAVVAEKQANDRRELQISKPRHINLATSPIVSCTMSEGYETQGVSMVTIVRKLSLGRYGLVDFLLDFWCLGVKEAFFRVLEADEYEYISEQLDAATGSVPIEPARARKLVRDAAAYGASNGLPPPENLAEMERILGDVEPEKESAFVFGDNGRPHYVVGPNDTPQRQKFVIARLKETFGPSGFEFSLAEDFDDEAEEDAQYDYVDDDGNIIQVPSNKEFEEAIAEIEADPELLAEIDSEDGEPPAKS